MNNERSNEEYINALTCGEIPSWVVAQLADDMDRRDQALAAARRFVSWVHERQPHIFLGAIGHGLLNDAAKALGVNE
jgi:hypothetical protein